jgi:NAD(P)-dependent dehydrogenase (short-subunit alcohol dehydrogenase family)
MDLADLGSVRAAAAALQRLPHIDFLILNAGVMVSQLHKRPPRYMLLAGRTGVLLTRTGQTTGEDALTWLYERCQFDVLPQACPLTYTKDGFEMQIGALRAQQFPASTCDAG